MNKQYTLDDRVNILKSLILEDIKQGIIPNTVKSYSELHDYVDANEYLPLAIPDIKFVLFEQDDNGELHNAEWTNVANQIMDIADAWLKTRC